MQRLVLCALALCCASASAADRPQAPSSVNVTASSPTRVLVRFFQPQLGPKSTTLYFEIEQTIDGIRIPHHDEAKLSTELGPKIGYGEGARSFEVQGLTPQRTYCFRIWTRTGMPDRLRSDNPSALACATTPPYPPLAPLDAKAQLRSFAGRVPNVSWSAPDMSGWRGIDRYTVERQSPPGPNRPWIPEKTVSGGPNGGGQSTTFGIAHTITTSAIDPQQTHVYRICAVNQGGKTCAEPVALAKDTRGPQQAEQYSTAARIGAAAPTPAAATGAGTVSAAQRLQAALEQQRAQQQAAAMPTGGAGGTRPDGAAPAPQAPATNTPAQPAGSPPAWAVAPRLVEPRGNLAVQGTLRVRSEEVPTLVLPRASFVQVEWVRPSATSGPASAGPPAGARQSTIEVPTANLQRGAGVPMPQGADASGQWRVRARYGWQWTEWSNWVVFDYVAQAQSQAAAAPVPPGPAQAAAPIAPPALTPQPLPHEDARSMGSDSIRGALLRQQIAASQASLSANNAAQKAAERQAAQRRRAELVDRLTSPTGDRAASGRSYAAPSFSAASTPAALNLRKRSASTHARAVGPDAAAERQGLNPLPLPPKESPLPRSTFERAQ